MKRVLYFLYQLFIWAPIFLVATILTALITTIGCLCGGEKIFSHYPGSIWSKLTCIITLCPVKVIGREKLDKKQSYVFVANHQGAYDIFLIYGYLGQHIKWVMKQSLRKIPLVGKACEAAGFIFVDNSSPKAATKTISDAKKRLKDGASIVIFPEGSRSRTGKMDRFKKGAYQMALDLKLPIVPVTINGTYEVMPIGTFLINPHKLELIIHDPIPTEDIKIENMRDAATEIGKLINQSKDTIESGLWEQYRDTSRNGKKQ
ncbi:1-acyl-sn-glycerol-3-phosphate acyltransferase [Bacteroidales bacterium OttesenSCG-928-A17]|nr:1-acyl-sn-glycerol-3-phosphate acyltransferase [Bacteroidales bacterium OttesenSCG-928-A17]